LGCALLGVDLLKDKPSAAGKDEGTKHHHEAGAEAPDAVVDGVEFAHLIRRMEEFAE
jgi:hypothetical protein